MKNPKNVYLQEMLYSTIERATLLSSINIPIILGSKEYNSGLLLNSTFWAKMATVQPYIKSVIIQHKGKQLVIDILNLKYTTPKSREVRKIKTQIVEHFNYNPSRFYVDTRIRGF